MSKPSRKPITQNNEVRSGFLVVVCFVVLMGLLFMSGKSMLFKDTAKYHLSFNYISGLKKNAPVHFAGYEVGKVSDIQFVGGNESKVDVTITVDATVPVRETTEAYITILGFMGETYIELSLGDAKSAVLAPNSTIQGTDPVPMMEIIKKGTAIIEEFEKSSVAMNNLMGNIEGLIGNVDGLVDNVDGIVVNNEDEMNSIFSNLDSSSENLKLMTEDLKSHPWKLLKKGEEDTSDEDKDKRLLLF